MGRLRHRTAPQFTYFVTTKTWQNRAVFHVQENAKILIESLLGYRDKGKYLVHEFVVMPDHLHALLTPAGETSLERAMMLIKGGSSHEIHKRREVRLEIWQAGFHEESIRDANDYLRKVEYIHMNPVRANLVERAEDWQYGSACGAFKTDPVPGKFTNLASGAKAPSLSAAVMSDLKVRPPKNLGDAPSSEVKVQPPKKQSLVASGAKAPILEGRVTRGLKPPPPEDVANVTQDIGGVTATPGLRARPLEEVAKVAVARGLKSPPPEKL